jgi:hypothetical protein
MSGFTAVKKQGASETAGMVQTYAVAASHATLLAPGDACVITGTSNTDGVAAVDAGNATTANTGVITSIDFILSGENLTETGLPAGIAGTVKVNVDPLQNYEVESNATLLAADVGLNIGIDDSAATKLGGLTVSNMVLDAATKATTQTLPYRIVALLPGKDSGVLGDRALVRPNASTINDGAAGV